MDLYFPKNLKNQDLFPNHIQFTFFERRSTFASGMTDQVHLFMPENFKLSTSVAWESKSIKDMVTEAGMGAAGMLPGNLGKKTAGLLKAAQRFVTGPAGDLMSLQSGEIVNPYLTQIFKGVPLREFSYTFKLFPQSYDDCDTIQSIIRTFRAYALPSSNAALPYFITYPGEVEIRYIFNNDENPYIHKFKRSVITSVEADYTGEGSWAVMRNGFPATTTLNLHLAELEIIVREDVFDNF